MGLRGRTRIGASFFQRAFGAGGLALDLGESHNDLPNTLGDPPDGAPLAGDDLHEAPQETDRLPMKYEGAGVPDVGSSGAQLARRITEIVRVVQEELGLRVQNDDDMWLFEEDKQAGQRGIYSVVQKWHEAGVPRLVDIIPRATVKTEEAWRALQPTKIFLHADPDGTAPGAGWVSPHDRHIYIAINVKILFRDNQTNFARLYKTLDHEIRHAIDLAYHGGWVDWFEKSRHPGRQNDRIDDGKIVPGPEEGTLPWWRAYLLNPTELMAWAGNVAHSIEMYPKDGNAIRSAVGAFVVPVKQPDSTRTQTPILSLVEPNQRPRFLQMVVDALDQRYPGVKTREERVNPWQLRREDVTNRNRIAPELIGKLLEFGYMMSVKDRVLDRAEYPNAQAWVASNSAEQLAMVLENNYDVYQYLQRLPRNSIDEYPSLEDLIDRYKSGADNVRAADVISREDPRVNIKDVIPSAPSGYFLPPIAERNDDRNFERRVVPVSQLISTQIYAIVEDFEGAMKGLAEGKLPRLIPQPDGKLLVDDGNHRLSKQILDGATTVEALVYIGSPRHASAESFAAAYQQARAIYEQVEAHRQQLQPQDPTWIAPQFYHEFLGALLRLVTEGSKWSEEIVRTRAIPAKQHKAVEMVARLFARRSLPKWNKQLEWFRANQKRFELLVAAGAWPARANGGDASAETGGEVFNVGNFEVHNVVGAQGAALQSAQEIMSKAVAALPAVRMQDLAYGPVYLVGQIERKNWAAWYVGGKDEIYLRPQIRGISTEECARNMVHEIGHRYWKLRASDAQRQAWQKQFDEVGRQLGDESLPPVGTRIPFKDTTIIITKYRQHARSTAIVAEVSDASTNEPLGAMNIGPLARWFSQQRAKIAFPTGYSATSAEEYFCEAVSLYAFGILQEPHLSALTGVLGNTRTASAGEIVHLPGSFLDGWEFGNGEWQSFERKPRDKQLEWAEKVELTEPIEVNVTKDGHALFNDGHHRATAARLRNTTVPVIVTRNDMNPEIWAEFLDRVGRGFTLPEINPEGYNLNRIGIPSVEAMTAMRAAKIPRGYPRTEFYENFKARTAAVATDVEFRNELTGSSHGQKDGRLSALRGGQIVGFIDWAQTRPDVVHVRMVEVAAGSRRQGIGSALMYQLRREFPGAYIDEGYKTDDGAALLQSMPSSTIEDPRVREELERDLEYLSPEHEPSARLHEMAERLKAAGDPRAELYEALAALDYETMNADQVFEGRQQLLSRQAHQKHAISGVWKGEFYRVPSDAPEGYDLVPTKNVPGAQTVGDLIEAGEDWASTWLVPPEAPVERVVRWIVTPSMEDDANQDFGTEAEALMAAIDDIEKWRAQGISPEDEAQINQYTVRLQALTRGRSAAYVGMGWMSPAGQFHETGGEPHAIWADQHSNLIGFEPAAPGEGDWSGVMMGPDGRPAQEHFLDAGWIRVVPGEGVEVRALTGANRELIKRVLASMARSAEPGRVLTVDVTNDWIQVPITMTGRPDFSKLGQTADDETEAAWIKERMRQAPQSTPETFQHGQPQDTEALLDVAIDTVREFWSAKDIRARFTQQDREAFLVYSDTLLAQTPHPAMAARAKEVSDRIEGEILNEQLGELGQQAAVEYYREYEAEEAIDPTWLADEFALALENLPSWAQAGFETYYKPAADAEYARLLQGPPETANTVRTEDVQYGDNGALLFRIRENGNTMDIGLLSEEAYDYIRETSGLDDLTTVDLIHHQEQPDDFHGSWVTYNLRVTGPYFNQEWYLDRSTPNAGMDQEAEGNSLRELDRGIVEGPMNTTRDWSQSYSDGTSTIHLGQRQPWVAIDLDNTLLAYEHGMAEKGLLGEPMEGAREFTQELRSLGWRISVFTARLSDLDEQTAEATAQTISQHLESYDVAHDDVWLGRKPRADYFVDDKAIAFGGDFDDVLLQLTSVGLQPPGAPSAEEDAGDGPPTDAEELGLARPPGIEEILG